MLKPVDATTVLGLVAILATARAVIILADMSDPAMVGFVGIN